MHISKSSLKYLYMVRSTIPTTYLFFRHNGIWANIKLLNFAQPNSLLKLPRVKPALKIFKIESC
jgi:hypothetical protein